MHRSLALLPILALVAASCGGPAAPATQASPPSTAPAAPVAGKTVPPGPKLSAAKVQEFAALFNEQPYIGGQVAPRLSKWITPDTLIFAQFDKFPAKDATEVRYIGVGQKGVFCAEAQPDQPKKSFTHLHRPSAPSYAEGHGGPPGTQGYWLSWMATATFTDSSGRKVTPGIDYQFSPLTPPSCGANVPKADFTAPDQKTLSKEDLAKFIAFFDDKILQGGQTPPRIGKWLNEDLAMFLQLDNNDPAKATTVRYMGIYERGTFCSAKRPSADFPHYHRLVAPTYAEGHGGKPGETEGFWLAWMSTATFTDSQGRKVVPGIDREFSPIPIPEC